MHKNAQLLISSSLLLFSHTAAATVVELQTNLGTIAIQLNDTKAPITVKNFLAYVNNGFYKKTIFHRVIKDFMIQGGGVDKTTLSFKTPSYTPIKLEANNGLKNVAGSIAMARTSDLNSATSQFFINTVTNSFLDYSSSNAGYAVFGTVVKGMELVTAVGNSLNSASIYSQSNLAFINDSLVYIDNAYSTNTVSLDKTLSKTRITLNGAGTVTSLPSGINCGSSCVLSKTATGTIKLTATPAVGYAFAGWRGDCTGYSAVINLDASKGNHNCTASFIKAPNALQ